MRRSNAACLMMTLYGWAGSCAYAQVDDTGQIACYDASGITGTVTPATSNPVAPGFAGQDCTRGRSAADAMGVLAKLGAGARGFDFTKIANNGSVLPASAVLGSGANDWACTRDNVTGLIWEVKTESGPRDADFQYSWFDLNGTVNGGNPGSAGSSTCGGTLPGNACNTAAFVGAVNATTLCGFNDWRMPQLAELGSIVDYGSALAPFVEADYFPVTRAGGYWTGQNYALNAAVAWLVDANTAAEFSAAKSAIHRVRLVRSVNALSADPGCVPGNPRIAPDQRYFNNGDGTVFDFQSQLVWKRCVEGTAGAGCGSGTASSYGSWAAALQAARDSRFAGWSDWRLPNVKELATLVETGCVEPAINSNVFPQTPATTTWTSTAVAATGIDSWLVKFNDGATVGDAESNGFGAVRLVRSGTQSAAYDSADRIFGNGLE